MSPIPSVVLAAACTADGLCSKRTSYESSRSEAATSDSNSASPFPSSILEIDHSPPPVVPATSTPSPAQSSIALEQNMTDGAKIGLAVIPMVALICVILALFMYRWRNPKMRKPRTREVSPPVPSKDGTAPVQPPASSSTNSNPRCSKVCSMVAISAPIRNVLHRETSVIGESRPNDRAVYIWPEEKRRMKAKVVRFQHPALPSMDSSSPVEIASPFRRKHGNTLSMKRAILGTELCNVWPAPSPPPTVWIRSPQRIHQASTPVPAQDNYF